MFQAPRGQQVKCLNQVWHTGALPVGAVDGNLGKVGTSVSLPSEAERRPLYNWDIPSSHHLLSRALTYFAGKRYHLGEQIWT